MSMGPACPRCGNAMTLAVVNSRPSKGGVLRRRRCLECDERFSTRETVEGTHVPAGAIRALEERLYNVNRALRGDFDKEVG